MAVLNPSEIFFTVFEPQVANRFILYVDGFPSFMIKGFSGLEFTQDEILLNHINIQRKVKGRGKWGDVNMTLFNPITPSGAQATMNWVRLHHESVTGRDGYSDFYKKDLTVDIIGPVGDIISEWIIKGAFIKSAKFADLNWDQDAEAQNIQLTLGIDYAVNNY